MKKSGLFDCAKGSWDGAETCELIGLYMLNKLTEGKYALFRKGEIGLYRDDGLSIVRIRGRQGNILVRLQQKIKEIFKKEDLSIIVEHDMKETDFLDVKLNLKKTNTDLI